MERPARRRPRQLGDDLHALVNNAARTEFRSFFDIDVAEWDDVLATNLRGTYLGCRVVGAYLRDRGAGRIVNLASDAAFAATGGSGVHYAASKAGVVAVTRRAASELAPYGVTVNAIAPAAIDGALAREVLRDRLDEKLRDIPVGRARTARGSRSARLVPRLRRRGLHHRRDARRQRRRAHALTCAPVLESPGHSVTKGGTVTSTETGLGIEAKSDAIYELVEQGSQVERLATGFTFTEGPIWHPKEQYLLFSDMPGDVRRKFTPDGTVVEVRNFSNKCNGMTYDADLNLLVCEHVTSSLVKESPDGTREIIAQEFEGEELNSPNDVCVHSSGAIYFSDPWYGRMPGFGHPRERRLGFQGVYRIAPGGGDPELIVGRDEFEMPNGICFSPDETLFYINDTPGAYIKVYDAAPNGSISNGRMFFEGVGSGVIEEGIPDGMKCDERGNIWVTGPGGIWVISAAGEHLGTILVPENTGNLTWGGEDWHTVYIPSSTSLYSIRTIVGPRHEPYMG